MDVVSDIYVMLREGKFSVGVMASRVAESINDGASFVILDTRNKVLPGRLRGDSQRVSSLPSAAAAISADLAVVEERVRSLVESTALTAVVLLLPPNQARPLVGALSCAISKAKWRGSLNCVPSDFCLDHSAQTLAGGKLSVGTGVFRFIAISWFGTLLPGKALRHVIMCEIKACTIVQCTIKAMMKKLYDW
ncbi:hypothetical protein CAPTEDRAFT_211744 [Capitella teleta]|uniref:Uncharacterized protein n=1 Tax=Capitella teleta TaxID=283909 RepID=R7VHN7_CAPTE|nr:hypothetical protein CAPTEDRAFT_211744 [Capitella teleta]|eukprot:ELU15180.1 hypothetical protein CAPTEDRAFT_211744 [Capitella teleta]